METVTYTGDDDDTIIVVEEQKEGDHLAEVQREARKRADSILGKLTSSMTYKLADRPPWYSTIVLAFQHFLTMFGGCLAIPFVLGPALCIEGKVILLSKLLATICFLSGIQTFIMTTFGVRLPIVQGPSFAFVVPLISMMNVREACPAGGDNSTNVEDNAEFYSRMQETQGALIVSSFFEIVLGFTGIISILMKYIGPLTIAPTVTLIGLSLTPVATEKCSVHWGIATFTMALIILCSQYIDRLKVPCLGFSKSNGCHVFRYPLFRLFPIFIAAVLSWLLCFILTITDVFPNDPSSPNYRVRTDANSEGVANTPWFYFPYPGQWGAPSFSAGGVFGMSAAVLASIVESIGDYYACAKLSGAPNPPDHALNRGIGIEGIGGFLAGLWGACVSATSYSTNIGMIGLTKVSSLLVIQVMSTFLVMMGILLKFGAVFATIPEPIIGGIIAVSVGMVTSVGISNLQYVDINSPRNLFIVGFSLLLGTSLPDYMSKNPHAIQTGSATVDQIFAVLLGTSMFIGGLTGFILDNTIPGTPAERGIGKMLSMYSSSKNDDDNDDAIGDDNELKTEVSRLVNQCYELPYGMSYIRTWAWTSRLPFCPTFSGLDCNCKPKDQLWRRKPRETDGTDTKEK
ncbi:solute carrier family 23 member 1 [Strongylocentrotus purpuratus]|uniref:Solute carrier family 23 member 2 n=1 Tax=Strongylocentrotus purpuratus TaxID=7668 RepID=A0A7M7T3X3_STRPU|nr:solute carrier family 23 member 1 [Strongylocentrotus purpuratus]XP_030852022.1 solute carrier family 23 member 1 [Strongylocentrotus purpuratus]